VKIIPKLFSPFTGTTQNFNVSILFGQISKVWVPNNVDKKLWAHLSAKAPHGA
jgi:hypothetical protein